MRDVLRLLLLGGDDTTFSPANISGYAVHYDFGDTSTLYQDSSKTVPVASDGDVIGAVENKAQAGTYDATQATTASKPVWRAAGYGESDGVDDRLLYNIGLSGWAEGTGFMAFRRTDAANVRHMWCVYGTVSGIWADNGAIADGFLSSTRPQISNTLATIDDNHIITARQDGSNLLYRVSNTEAYNAPQTFLLDTLIDSTLFNSGAAAAPGRIYEVILYDRALTASEINQVEAYLNAKVAAF